MSSTQPASTTELKEYALRKLGKPVVEVNLADEQMNDLIDEAIQYFQEYHFDGTERHFLVELVEASTLTFSSASTGTFEEGETITGATRIPIIEVAFGEGKSRSIPQEMTAELYAKFEAGQDAGYTWDWGSSRKGSWKPDGENTSINRYTIVFVHKQQTNIDNGRMRTIRLIWALEEDATPQWTGQIPR